MFCVRSYISLCCVALLASGSLNFARGDDPAGPNPFPGRAPAPSLEGGVEWLNTAGEINLKELRGKVVLLDFWTYCCINCMHILPDLKYLEHKYANQLVVIGVHSAKFDNEKESENIREAILRYEIEHPVVNDANMIIARKYAFNSWPTLVLIDPEGNYVGRQPGEGNRELFDEVIGRMVTFHRAKGTLDETPFKFHMEREKVAPTPLRYPGKVLADEQGQRLFIADSNHNRIIVTSLEGQLQDVIGTGQIGRRDGSYAEAMFDHPQGMCLVGDTLYVADTENHLLRTVDLATKQVATLAGVGQQARTRVQGGPLLETALNSPWALYHLNGVLYICMAGPHQLWQHKLGSNLISVFAGSGREDILDGPLAAAALAQPSGITSDGTFLYHVDSEGSAVRKVSTGVMGEVVTVVGPHEFERGASLFEFGDIDGVGDAVRLQHPLGIVYHEGHLFVADTYNDKIKLVNLKTRECVTWLGTGKSGKNLDPVELSEPAGLSIAGGKLYIADTNNHRILVMDLTTKGTRELTIAGLTPPPPPTAVEEPVDLTMALPVMEVVASGTELKVTVAFELPEGYKLNQLANVSYRIVGENKSGLINPSALDKRQRAEKGDKTAMFTIPLTGQTGAENVGMTVNYQYCREGVGAVCRFGTQTWTVPLKVAPGGTGTMTLTAKAAGGE